MRSLYPAGAIFDSHFQTVNPSTGANYTLAGTGTISVYKNNSTTESTAGVTLDTDFDSRTGFNHVRIDTTADGTFYSNGDNFDITITQGTVNSVSVVGAVVGAFTLGERGAILDTTLASYSSQTSFTLTAGSADNNAYLGHLIVIRKKGSQIQYQKSIISGYTGSTKTVTLPSDPGIFTMAAGDQISILPPPSSPNNLIAN